MISMDTILDFSVLEAEKHVPSCESEEHDEKFFHADGGERYLEVRGCGCGVAGEIVVRCSKFIEVCKARGILCTDCNTYAEFDFFFLDRGPVNP